MIGMTQDIIRHSASGQPGKMGSGLNRRFYADESTL
jgi:hypothetical protein